MIINPAPRVCPEFIGLALTVLTFILGRPLSGQTYQEVAPKAVREVAAPNPAQAAPLPPEPEANPDEILVPTLTGLRLIPSPDQLSRVAPAAGTPLVIDGLPWLDRKRTEAVLKGFLSHPLTRRDLTVLVRALVLVGRKSDRPVIDIYAPPQDVSTGVVQLVVLVAKLGQLHVEGNRWFASGLISADVHLVAGQEITGQTLFEDVDYLNQNPFRQVALVYARGADPGMTDVILRVSDQRPERVYASYDDSGNEATGLGRVSVGFNLGNLWQDDQQFSYQYSRSTDFDRMQAHSASYSLPLFGRNTLEIFGDWAEAKSQTGGILDLTGISWAAGARYTVPLPIMGSSYSHAFDFGADYKWSNNNLAFGGTQVFTSPAAIAQGVLGYTGTLVDSLGSTRAAVTGFYSPGGLGGLDRDSDFTVQRAGAKTQFEYVQLTLTRVQRLPQDFTAVLAITGQWSSARLLPSDQFGLGGALSVRGYDERIVNGDGGVSGQWELRTPSRHLLHRVPDQTQALVFFDAGRDWDRSLMPGEEDQTLASAGPGLRISVGANGILKADYGWQLNRLAGTRSGRLHLSALVSY